MNDITALAQRMKGQTVKAPYYLAECTHCGEMYPSNYLLGGEPLFAGDYNDCLCPHCNTDDSLIADLGASEETAVAAWNFQQKRIDALVEALEKTQQYAKERDEENQGRILTVGRLRVEREALESRTVTVKLPDYRATYKEPFALEIEHHVRKALNDVAQSAGIQVIEGEGQ